MVLALAVERGFGELKAVQKYRYLPAPRTLRDPYTAAADRIRWRGAREVARMVQRKLGSGRMVTGPRLALTRWWSGGNSNSR
jgi:hypothetical protein